MLNKEEEENNEKIKEYQKILEGLESLFTEFQNINKQQIKKKVEKKISPKKEIKTSLNTHELYKLILQSELHKGKLTLLDEKQALNDNESYQKIMELFLEERDTIPSIETENGDPDKYILTQLYTAFSLLERKIYLSGNKNTEEKNIHFLKNLNLIKFNKESKITPQILELFNHNILRISDIYHKKENKINANNNFETKKNNEEKNNNRINIIEAKEIKRDKNINNTFDTFNYDGNIILNDEIIDEGVQKVDSLSYEKKYENIDLSNEEYKKIKSINMRKILDIENDKLKNITMNEFQELINEVYTSGEVTNKELENKITNGKGKLFIDEKEEDNIRVNNNINFQNDIEISLNPEEKMENDEEIADENDILDFDQEEIKNQPNKTSFFEKEDFEKEFFPNSNINEENKNIDENIKTEKEETENIFSGNNTIDV